MTIPDVYFRRCWVVRREDNDQLAYTGVHTYNVAFELCGGFDDVYVAWIDDDEFCDVHEDEPAEGCIPCRKAVAATP